MTVERNNAVRLNLAATALLVGSFAASRASELGSAAPPAIISGKIVTSSVSATVAPAAPKFSFSFNAPGYYNYNTLVFTGPSGQSLYTEYGIAPPGAEKAGSITYFNPVSIYTQPGTWTMTSASITDLAGNVTYYTQSQLAALFPSLTFTVINKGQHDITPPTVSSGKIDTPRISLSSATPFFKVTLTAADNLSGIDDTYLYLNEPDGTAYPALALVVQPTQPLSGPVIAGALLNTAGLPTGTWSITGYAVCDLAGNCLSQTDAATLKQQLGTTTFTVTP